MSVLLVTRSDDNGAVDLVARALVERGAVPIRLDTDRYPQQLSISTAYVAGIARRTLSLPEQTIDLGEVSASWYRRFFAGGSLPSSLGDTREACVHESRRTLYGTIASLGCFELDPLIAVREADHKELQLRRAAACGLLVPATLFSNDPAAVRAFFDDVGGRMVTKMQSSFAIYRGGVENVVFTNVVHRRELDDLEGLRFAPMIFQEWLDKELELRVTVVGRQAFAASIDSQRRQQTAVDWRRDGVGLLDEWQPYVLPADIEQALLRLTESFHLNYAAADIVLTKDGRHVFLELNAGGEWLWLARAPGLPIAEALADTLLDKVPRTSR
ncbi:MAG: MvdC/MvdD family ATP grasp protein [Myxococcota bacterium]